MYLYTGYMNVALEQTEEYVDGQLKAKYGDAFIRGNNILYISTQKKKKKLMGATTAAGTATK